MNKIAILLLLLLCYPVFAGGLNASFQSSQNPCGTDPGLVFCYQGRVTSANALIDTSGSNINTYSEELDHANWTKNTVTVTADQVRGPGSMTLNAELMTPTGADSYVYQDAVGVVGTEYTCAFALRTVTGNVDLSIHLYNQTHTAIRTAKAITVTRFWQTFYVSGILAAGDTHAGCTLGGNSTWSTAENIYAVRANLAENDRWNPANGSGIYHYTDGTTKPLHYLSNTNSPSRALSDQESGGNRKPARRLNGTDQHYSKAVHGSLDVLDGNHTITIYALQDVSEAVALLTIGTYLSNGIAITLSGDIVYANYSSGAGVVFAGSAGAITQNQWHVYQIVRKDDIATVYLNGIAGTPVDVSTYGITPTGTMYLGRRTAAGSQWDGDIAFAKLESYARNEDELASDREKIWGMSTGQGSSFAAWDISRSTTAMKTFKAGGAHPINSKMTEVAAGVPRVTFDGLLVEGQGTNVIDYSEQFDQWTATRASVVANTAAKLAPDGSQTVDILHEDATGANTHLYRRANIFNVTNTVVYTYSIYVAPLNRDWIRLVVGATVGPAAYFNVSNGLLGTLGGDTDYANIEAVAGGFYRCSITWTAGATEVNTPILYIAEADSDITFDGLNQDSLYVWGSQVEASPFPTSYIEVPSTADVTRTADDISLSPCDDVQSCVLPLAFGGAGQPSKLTAYVEMKCQFSAAADIGVTRSIIEISGNAGTASSSRNRFHIYVISNGVLAGRIRDDADADHFVTTAVDPVDFSEWHSVRLVVDFSDLSRMDMWLDGDNSAMNYTGNSGTAEFDLTNTKIRLGQEEDGTVNGNCQFRKGHPLVWAGEIRP